MLLEDVVDEYLWHYQAEGFTFITMKNKKQELKQTKGVFARKKGISEIECIKVDNSKAFVRSKKQLLL